MSKKPEHLSFFTQLPANSQEFASTFLAYLIYFRTRSRFLTWCLTYQASATGLRGPAGVNDRGPAAQHPVKEPASAKDLKLELAGVGHRRSGWGGIENHQKLGGS